MVPSLFRLLTESVRLTVLQKSLPLLMTAAMVLNASNGFTQPLGEPDRGAPGDVMIQAWLATETARLTAGFADDVQSLNTWLDRRPEYMDQYLYMLGLSPLPERTPVAATITGTFAGDGYHVDMLHYQSMPGLYVTANLYRPADNAVTERLPAVLYVCGHSGRGRNGNKVAYQSHGIWFARHGYVCLVVDTLQLGEIAAHHHGTYRLNRWWWHARGYTPAGVEAWNGIRGIDYLISRPDVDSDRLAVTGISGGGAATFWIAAADERVHVAVPVSGMADLESYVPNRVINGHCDCMFVYNTFRWPWTRIAALAAPRPLLFINSDQDPIFPMDANDRVINRLERLYSLYGSGDQVDAVVSVGGHAYRQDIRQAAYRFINLHLRQDPRSVLDSEYDIVSEGSNPGTYPIPPEQLRVFPTDADLPTDEVNTRIDELFVPVAAVNDPPAGTFAEWKLSLLDQLRRVTFGALPRSVPPAIPVSADRQERTGSTLQIETEPGIRVDLRSADGRPLLLQEGDRRALLLVVLNEAEAGTLPEWIRNTAPEDRQIVLFEPRGTGRSRWTSRNPPNYVPRSHALLGLTVDTGRVRDVIAAADFLAQSSGPGSPPRSVSVVGSSTAGLIAACAALLTDQIAEVTLMTPPVSFMDDSAPQLLNVLRVCDVTDILGMLAPRPLTVVNASAADFRRTTAAYLAADAPDQLLWKSSAAEE